MADGTTQAYEVEVAPGTPLAGMAGLVPGEPTGYSVIEEQAPAPAPPGRHLHPGSSTGPRHPG